MSHQGRAQRKGIRKKVIALSTPGDFKEFYSRQEQIWERDSGLEHLLAIPTPWNKMKVQTKRDGRQLEDLRTQYAVLSDMPTDQPPWGSQHKIAREKYIGMTFDEKLRDSQSYREVLLLREIAHLKGRLGEGPPGDLTICCGNRADLTGDDRHAMYTEYVP